MSEEHLFHFLFSLLKKNQHKSEQILIFFWDRSENPVRDFEVMCQILNKESYWY